MTVLKMAPYREKEAKSDVVITGHPVIDRIFQNRGIQSPDEVSYRLQHLIHPFEMKGIVEASDLLIDHIQKDSKILVVGDYDCDGATSTSIAVEGLRILGAKNVSFLIPDRMKHGYGLSPAIAKIAGKSKPDLIITVDNGIASFEGAQAVKDLEHPCDLLVTDHHLEAKDGSLPNADVIVNPNQTGCTFPSKAVAGCGVIFYTLLGLRVRMKEKGIFNDETNPAPKLTPLLDLVALGTVADVVPLDRNNRILVSAGLQMINSGLCRPGIRHILSQKKRVIGQIKETDFGFAVGPCINAAGRLDDMSIGINCLLAEEDHVAKEYATILTELNERRKSMTQEMTDEAIRIIESENLDSDDSSGVCLYRGDWHEGVVGILAGRVKDRMGRPVIAFTDTELTAELKDILNDVQKYQIDNAVKKLDSLIEEKTMSEEDIASAIKTYESYGEVMTREEVIEANPNAPLLKALYYSKEKLEEKGAGSAKVFERLVEKFGEIKGSCRSIDGIHFKHVLDEINKSNPEILTKFGGHAMAAGLTIKLEHFDEFRKKFNSIIERELTDEMKLGAIEVDVMNMDINAINKEFIEALQKAGPFGAGFPPPYFGLDLKIKDFRILQDRHVKMVLASSENPELNIEGIQFSCVDPGKPHGYRVGDHVRVFFQPDLNKFRGKESVQLLIQECQNVSLAKEMEYLEDDEEVSLDGVQSHQKNDQKTHLSSALGR